MNNRNTIGWFVVSVLLSISCGGGDSGGGPPTSPTPPPNNSNEPVATTTITITSSGVSPKRITVAPGSRVTFVNNDNRSHEMSSDEHPVHDDCPPINDVGFIAVGQTKLTGNLVVVRTCGFHDHNTPTVTALQGEIIVR